MLHQIEHEVSEGLRRENEVHDQIDWDAELVDFSHRHPNLFSYLGDFARSLPGSRFLNALPQLPPRSRILDVGVGRGGSSISLAAMGHLVVAVEPCLNQCLYLERAATAFGLPLDVCCCTAEALDRLPVGDFDFCIFNASLHHCDDPELALRLCFERLLPGGTILVLNEPILKCYTSKERYQRSLQEQPEAMGHYGGNEHAYYYREYVEMLRAAGFAAVESQPSTRYLFDESSHSVPGLGRRIYHRLIRFLWHSGKLGSPAFSLMCRFSLVQLNFRAQKAA